MDARHAERIETIANVAAAAMLAVAVAYAVSRFMASTVTIAAAAAAALFVALQILRSIAPTEPELPLAQFEPAQLAFEELDELLLTEADRIEVESSDELLLTEADRMGQTQTCDADEVLVLDDVLTELGDSSRVVRLFDASAIPTPGQLKARIDRHLGQTDQSAPVDASEALYEALAKLRHSLK